MNKGEGTPTRIELEMNPDKLLINELEIKLSDCERWLKEKDNEIKKIFQIASNAIYFRDNSDYLTALYEICEVIKPGDESIGETFIEEMEIKE